MKGLFPFLQSDRGSAVSDTKKPYVSPSVVSLGTMSEKTAAGAAPLSDQLPFLANSAFPPPGS
jgi:hypothetical protein